MEDTAFEIYGSEDYEEFNLTLDEYTAPLNFTADVILLEEYPPSLLYFGVVCCIAFTVVGIPGNLITIIALLRSPRFRNATSAFIVNLCFADILYCSFSIPLSALTLLYKGWPYGHTICVTFAISRYSNAAVLILTLVGISINRYVMIVHPKSYEKIYNKFTMVVMIMLTWMIPFVLLAPTTAGVWGAFMFDPQIGECSIVPVRRKSSKNFIYTFLFCLPTVVFVYCYARIFWTVRKSERGVGSVRSQMGAPEKDRGRWIRSLNCCNAEEDQRQHRRRRKRVARDLKVLRVIFVIFVTSVICYFPNWFVKVLKKEECMPALNILGYVGQYFSACVNPIIYVVMSKEYRKAYKNLCACSDHVVASSVSR